MIGISYGSDAGEVCRIAFNGRRWGKNNVSPFISEVDFDWASRTGPFQERSKKTLMVIFAGDEEKDLMDGLK